MKMSSARKQESELRTAILDPMGAALQSGLLCVHLETENPTG